MDQLQQDRFSGFAAQYDEFRPSTPIDPVRNIVKLYLPGDLSTVLDVGCGTGLSTFPWSGLATTVIGIEPNPDMIGQAEKLAADRGTTDVSFLRASSDRIPLGDASVDLITCSQSFHWMEPEPTLREFARLLRDGGMAAVYDCDWPPAVGAELETAFERTRSICRDALGGRRRDAKQWPKEKHLANMQSSGLFSFEREICFQVESRFDARAFIGLLESQGLVQSARKLGDPGLIESIDAIEHDIRDFAGDTVFPGIFTYRMQIALR